MSDENAGADNGAAPEGLVDHSTGEIIECPGEDCPLCSGEACDLCGAGSWNPNAPPCEHDTLERHSSAAEMRGLSAAVARAQAEFAGARVALDRGVQSTSEAREEDARAEASVMARAREAMDHRTLVDPDKGTTDQLLGDQLRATANARAFLDTLAAVSPRLVADLADRQAEIVRKVLDLEAKGTLALTLTYQPTKGGRVEVTAAIVAKPPKPAPPREVLEATPSGRLRRLAPVYTKPGRDHQE